MGRLNELLGAAAQWSRGVAAQFGLEEQEGVPTVAPELVPTSDIHARPELWHLMGGTLLIGGATVPAGGAGFRSRASFRPGLGELCIVEGITFQQTSPSTFITLAWTQSNLTTSTGALTARDARRIVTAGAAPQSGSRIETDNATALSGVAANIMVIAPVTNVVQYLQLDIVVVHPWRLMLYATADNLQLERHHWHVRVRPGTPRELAIGQI